jgi:hypothetical protein
MSCHWVYTKEVPEGRFWLPDCWGGLYGPDGCYCHAGEKAKEDREALEERIDQLERRIAKMEKRDAS